MKRSGKGGRGVADSGKTDLGCGFRGKEGTLGGWMCNLETTQTLNEKASHVVLVL